MNIRRVLKEAIKVSKIKQLNEFTESYPERIEYIAEFIIENVEKLAYALDFLKRNNFEDGGEYFWATKNVFLVLSSGIVYEVLKGGSVGEVRVLGWFDIEKHRDLIDDLYRKKFVKRGLRIFPEFSQDGMLYLKVLV